MKVDDHWAAPAGSVVDGVSENQGWVRLQQLGAQQTQQDEGLWAWAVG